MFCNFTLKGTMMNLINISNHPSDGWSYEQKRGWDKIIDIPFPNVPSSIDGMELLSIENDLWMTINGLFQNGEIDHSNAYFYIAGDFSLCSILYKEIGWQWLVFPTTEREVVEEKQEDGSVRRTAIFKFKNWRYLTLTTYRVEIYSKVSNERERLYETTNLDEANEYFATITKILPNWAIGQRNIYKRLTFVNKENGNFVTIKESALTIRERIK